MCIRVGACACVRARVCVCVCVCARVCACLCVCMRACVCACVLVGLEFQGIVWTFCEARRQGFALGISVSPTSSSVNGSANTIQLT